MNQNQAVDDDVTMEIVSLEDVRPTLEICPAMSKAIMDIVACGYGAREDELDRLENMLRRMAASEQVARLGRAVKAETLYDIQRDSVWAKLRNPETGELYKWYEFRGVLSEAFGISEGSLGNYLKDTRVARFILDIPPGEIVSVGGIKPIRAFQEVITGVDARSDSDISNTVRPVSKHAEEELERRYGPPPVNEDGDKVWKPHLQKLFKDSFAHDPNNPDATNRPPFELLEEGRSVNGRPHVHWKWGDHLARSIRWTCQYPDRRDDNGSVETGEKETGIIVLGDDLLPTVREDLERKLHIPEKSYG